MDLPPVVLNEIVVWIVSCLQTLAFSTKSSATIKIGVNSQCWCWRWSSFHAAEDTKNRSDRSIGVIKPPRGVPVPAKESCIKRADVSDHVQRKRP
jgi:hypothetical protein